MTPTKNTTQDEIDAAIARDGYGFADLGAEPWTEEDARHLAAILDADIAMEQTQIQIALERAARGRS